MRMIIVSGYSGSGKSIALETLEDLHYFCVDNLPLELLIPFARALLARESGGPLQTAAAGIDARNFQDELEKFPQILEELRALGLQVDVMFLHATDEVLVKRFSETRRRHPLGKKIPLLEAIAQEKKLLETIREHADLMIDTSRTNVHELRALLNSRLQPMRTHTLSLLFESFGFKNGVPADADFIFDVRCLPNPHWEPRLRPFTGRDEIVIDFLRGQPSVHTMIADLIRFLESWIPQFEQGNRSYLTVAIGCTGGQHRSVYIAESLATHFRTSRSNVATRHRELH